MRIHYEVYGQGTPTLLLLPAWSIVHSRCGRRRSPISPATIASSPSTAAATASRTARMGVDAHLPREYRRGRHRGHGCDRHRSAVAVGLSLGGHLGAMLAALHPERVDSAMLIAPAAPFGDRNPNRIDEHFHGAEAAHRGLGEVQPALLARALSRISPSSFSKACSASRIRPSRSRMRSAGRWKPTPETLTDTVLARFAATGEGEELYARVRCPVLVDPRRSRRIIPYAKGRRRRGV